MKSLSDPVLSTLNFWLQWFAIIGTALGLVSAIGLIFVRKETSIRQATQLARAQQEATAARQTADALRERMQPRQLTAQQQAKLVQLLKSVPKGPVTLMAIKMDREATAFANQLGDALSTAGFTVQPYGGPLILTMSPGVWLAFKSQTEQPPYTDLLRTALEAVGIKCALGPNPTVSAGQLLLGVGPKE